MEIRMKHSSHKERLIKEKRELCLKKRAAIIEKLGGRNIKSIESYETDSFYALYSELARLSGELASDLSGKEREEYITLSRLCLARTDEIIKKKKYTK